MALTQSRVQAQSCSLAQVSCPQLVSRKALGRVSSRHVARVLTTGTSTSNSTLRQVPLEEARSPLSAPLPAGSDPWEDEKWTKYKWTIYRGVAYDLTPYLEKHPGGRWLLNLAIGRDATGLFESYHLRPEVAVARLNRLPKLEGFPVEAVPTSPYPNDSPIYNAIRERVRLEVFKGVSGAQRTGSEGAALAVLSTAVITYIMYAMNANVFTGAMLGLAGAWIGLTIQHCGNHGAMSTNPIINNLMGLTNDVAGGSSLMWRYHHQVSHHIHCNDEAFDEDVFSSFPLLRFDDRMPQMWWHKYQHMYMWALFPFLQLAFQLGDVNALIANRTPGATLYGASKEEKATLVLGKVAHYTLLLAVPFALHGGMAALTGWAAYVAAQSIILASTFAVSHNVPETKPQEDNACRENLYHPIGERDWGGLNLQIEHHLFPAISFMHYPAISKIVSEECAKRGVPYAHYNTLQEILPKFVGFMRDVGSAKQVPFNRDGELVMLTKL
ncbi:MAG: hypothetical protein WDW38_003328 [Sanguina aurantia]